MRNSGNNDYDECSLYLWKALKNGWAESNYTEPIDFGTEVRP